LNSKKKKKSSNLKIK